MPLVDDLARRSRAEWGLRVALAAVIAILGYVSVAQALGYLLRSGNVVRAHALAPSDGRMTGLLAQSMAGAAATAADRRHADELAREALRQDPTAVAAVSTLGLDTQIRGNAAGAQRLFAYAERLSRRDLRTQVWAIETAVARGDVAGALRHYDIALRTSRDASDLLFPILASAASESAIQAALARTLSRQPSWTQPFIEYVASEATNASARASLFAHLVKADVPVSASASAATIDALIKEGEFDRAWTYYAAVHLGQDRRQSRDPGFTDRSETPSLLEWTPVEAPGNSVTLTSDGAEISAGGGGGGLALRQLQLLPPGVYRLEGRASVSDQQKGTLPYWTLTCLDGVELGRVPLSGLMPGTFATRLTVPPGCPAQYLSLVLQPTDSVAGADIRIERVWLAPAR